MYTFFYCNIKVVNIYAFILKKQCYKNVSNFEAESLVAILTLATSQGRLAARMTADQSQLRTVNGDGTRKKICKQPSPRNGIEAGRSFVLFASQENLFHKPAL